MEKTDLNVSIVPHVETEVIVVGPEDILTPHQYAEVKKQRQAKAAMVASILNMQPKGEKAEDFLGRPTFNQRYAAQQIAYEQAVNMLRQQQQMQSAPMWWTTEEF